MMRKFSHLTYNGAAGHRKIKKSTAAKKEILKRRRAINRQKKTLIKGDDIDSEISCSLYDHVARSTADVLKEDHMKIVSHKVIKKFNSTKDRMEGLSILMKDINKKKCDKSIILEDWEVCLDEVADILEEIAIHWNTLNRTEVLNDSNRKQFCNKCFTIIQLSVQCGPLKGSKAGYFKRKDSQTKSINLWKDNAIRQLKKLNGVPVESEL